LLLEKDADFAAALNSIGIVYD